MTMLILLHITGDGMIMVWDWAGDILTVLQLLGLGYWLGLCGLYSPWYSPFGLMVMVIGMASVMAMAMAGEDTAPMVDMEGTEEEGVMQEMAVIISAPGAKEDLQQMQKIGLETLYCPRIRVLLRRQGQ